MTKQDITYPIDHWSYSSMRTFLSDPIRWKKRYVEGVYEDTFSVAGAVGQAGHKALAHFYEYSQDDIPGAIEVGVQHLTNMQGAIDFGKTGSLEKALKTLTAGLNFYFEEVPRFDHVELSEEKILTEIELPNPDGSIAKAAIPIKAYPDLVIRDEDGRIVIRDTKFVSSFSDDDLDEPNQILQGMFYYHAVKNHLNEEPHSIVFDEIKTSENRDGSPQWRPIEIVFGDNPSYFTFFANLYNHCTYEMARRDRIYLPNLSDRMSAKDSFIIYSQNLLGTDDVILSEKKTRDVQFAEKRFVQSPVDQMQNEHITAEEKIRLKLQEFGLAVEMRDTHRGPNITLYTAKPSRGRKMSDFEKHANDIAYALESDSIRVLAPIPGTSTVGFEVPTKEESKPIFADRKDFYVSESLNIPIGRDVYGKTVVRSLADMPHLLVAGATGQGKSVFLSTAIESLISQNTPESLRFVMIDPKRVELSQYRDSAFLLEKPIYETLPATKAVHWLTLEMEARYNKLEKVGARNIDEYNIENKPLHRIVLVIDEFADLMLTDYGMDLEVGSFESLIVRIVQKARAVGIHAIIATQRPSVDVVTGLIKANLPARIAFATASTTDSRVILDQAGAEKLRGRGDCLYMDPRDRELKRLQGFFNINK